MPTPVVTGVPGDKPTPTPTPEPTFEDFVERLYTYALGRASDPQGMEYWVKQVVEEGATGADCARFFLLEAPEFMNRNLSDKQFLEVLYHTFYDRESDEAGKAYWLDRLTKDMTKQDVVNEFIESTEWCNVCAAYSVRSGAIYHKAEFASPQALKFVERLYTCCLGREAEEEGRDFWALALTNLEVTGYDLAEQFFTSDEFVRQNIKDEEYVRRLYTTFMEREPDINEINYWMNELCEGRQTRYSILEFFGRSEEFTTICKQYGIECRKIQSVAN